MKYQIFSDNEWVYPDSEIGTAGKAELFAARGGCCTAVSTVLAGILGTILFSLVLLAVTFAATSVIGAIFVGLLLFFFSLTITATACLVKCRANCD